MVWHKCIPDTIDTALHTIYLNTHYDITSSYQQYRLNEWVQGAAKQAPMIRLVDPSEAANAVLFLFGSLATAVTDISLPVDCGALLYHIS